MQINSPWINQSYAKTDQSVMQQHLFNYPLRAIDAKWKNLKRNENKIELDTNHKNM